MDRTERRSLEWHLLYVTAADASRIGVDVSEARKLGALLLQAIDESTSLRPDDILLLALLGAVLIELEKRA